MVLDYKRIDLFGSKLFEFGVLDAKMTVPTSMTDAACYSYVRHGHLVDTGPKGVVSMEVRESVLMKCGNYVSDLIPDKESGVYEAVTVHFFPEVLRKVYQDKLPDFLDEPQDLTTTVGMCRIKRSKLFSKYIDGILFFFENPEIVTEEILILKLKELFLLLANTKDAPLVHQILSNLFVRQTLQFKEVIEANIFSDVSVQHLAFLTHTSLSTFKREFNRIYNDTPANYFRTKRLEKAAELLKHSAETVSSIAYDCGFNDVSHFSKAFKRKFGITPTTFRQMTF